MTLILTCSTADWTVQVSDRRLVQAADPSKLVSEETNKVIIYHDHFAIGYTGLASIAGQSADEWIAHQFLAYPGTLDALDALVAEASRVFAKIALPRELRRQAITIAGHGFLGPSDTRVPIICRVSNALDANGRWLPKAKSTFSVDLKYAPPNRPFALVVTGQPLMTKTHQWLKRWLRRAIKRNAGPAAAARLLAAAIWETAGRYPNVGRSLMVVGVVKDETPGDYHVAVNRKPCRTFPAFQYIDPSGVSRHQLAPLVIFPNNVFLSRMTAMWW